MHGTPYCYYGDELGMTNAGFTRIDDYRDVQTLNEYQHLKNTGGDLQQYLIRIGFESRDNGRTPFQWDGTKNAGFTSGTPWINVPSNYEQINQAAQDKDPASTLNYFRKAVRLRKENPVLVYGKYTLLDKANPNVYAYTREGEGKKMLVLLNFSSSGAQVAVRINTANAKLLLSNYTDVPVIGKAGATITLKPYQAVVYKL